MTKDELASALVGDLVPIADAAKALGICTRTLRRYRDEPDGLPTVFLGGREHVKVATLRAFIEKREQQRNPRRGKAA